jgi:2,4-dienoyl-CoA reductase-like NADH-dependent reductase (Old Yellow Enzyme family)/thioredoxin reductase
VIEKRLKLPALFSPFKIGSMDLRNRIVMPPMGTIMANAEGEVVDRVIDYYAARAEGGAALITLELTDVHADAHLIAGDRGHVAIYADRFIAGLRRFTDSIHAAGAKASIQLYHPGRAMFATDPSRPPLGPSALACPTVQQMPRELTVAEIVELVEAFAEGARRAQEAGFDAVDVHGAHGYLIAQFMSAHSNRRTDAYGGDVAGRLRFPREVLGAIRNKVGAEFPIIFRYSADERIAGGRTIEESVAIAPLLVEAGADCLSISTGTLQSGLTHTVGAMGVPVALNVEAGAAVKDAVDVPVMVAGKLSDPVVAESVVANGKADLVAIGRGLIADPEWPKKASEGRWDDIRRCISCNQGCINSAVMGAPFACLVNPEAGRESEMALRAAPRSKRVLVAGGGPAGMEAARVAALRGHRVRLYERSDRLGGQFRIAAMPPWKQDISLHIGYMERQLGNVGVEVVLGEELTASEVEDVGPDAVVIATGGRPLAPAIAGVEADNVVTACDVLAGKVATGRRVLVVGSGTTGCETAEFLEEYGRRVTLVEMLPRLASDMAMGPRQLLLERLRQSQIRSLTSTKIVELSGNSVVVERKGAQETLSGIDTIVLAVGVESVNELADAIENVVSEVHVIGDARSPGTAMEAIAAGAEIGRTI